MWCALALERWKLRAGRHVKAWMRTLGHMEALASLATFAHENPDYAYPDVKDGEPRFAAARLGHPLLPRDRRVTNDVSLEGAGAALLVTGSSMSGKSTLLRAVGVNAALALAGAPVCASSLSLSPVRVRTSMRIKDSLEHGVSHFYAELTRLKRVVDGANGGERVLFLLDEILHGTNARERQIGARAVVRHLVAQGAIGAVSSHDMGLAVLEQETAGRVRNMHFEELVVEDRMTFDYKLKPGVVTSANALRLMKIVGIDLDFSEGERTAAASDRGAAERARRPRRRRGNERGPRPRWGRHAFSAPRMPLAPRPGLGASPPLLRAPRDRRRQRAPAPRRRHRRHLPRRRAAGRPRRQRAGAARRRRRAPAAARTEIDEGGAALLRAEGVDGAFVLFDAARGVTRVVNPDRAAARYVPPRPSRSRTRSSAWRPGSSRTSASRCGGTGCSAACPTGTAITISRRR